MSASVHNAVSGVESGQRQSRRADSPPKTNGSGFLCIASIRSSLVPDLTSGLQRVSRVRQKCAESEHRCACASVSGGCTWLPHVILWCRPVVPAAQWTPRSINHTAPLCACVCVRVCACDSGANTCYQSARGQHGEVLMFLHVCTHTCEHVPALRQVETKEQRDGA